MKNFFLAAKSAKKLQNSNRFLKAVMSKKYCVLSRACFAKEYRKQVDSNNSLNPSIKLLKA